TNRAIIITYKKFVDEMKPVMNPVGHVEIKEFDWLAVMVFWCLPDPSPVLGQMVARLQAGQTEGADILIGGSISAEAQPFKKDGLLNSILKRQIPFVAAIEPGADPAKQTEAAIKAGVNHLAVIGSNEKP